MLWVTVSLAIAGTLAAAEYTRSLKADGRTRTYLVYVPHDYDRARPAAAVLAFHGGITNARWMAEFSGLNEKAEAAGFIAVYPEGTGLRDTMLTFNVGHCCGYAQRNNVDDVAFVRALLHDLSRAVNLDPRRIYATGISNGGMMAYRLACELSDRIAAIAPVGGPIGTHACQPVRPVPVMHFHGSDDQFARFEGGSGIGPSRVAFNSVDHTISGWLKRNGCPGTAETTSFPDRVNDGTTAYRKRFAPCRDGAEVALVVIEGGGHTWPGRDPQRNSRLGKSTKDISANDLMWEFFQRHPLR